MSPNSMGGDAAPALLQQTHQKVKKNVTLQICMLRTFKMFIPPHPLFGTSGPSVLTARVLLRGYGQ